MKKSDQSGSGKQKLFVLPQAEKDRVTRLLQRSVDKEAGKISGTEDMNEDNPDGCKSDVGYFL